MPTHFPAASAALIQQSPLPPASHKRDSSGKCSMLRFGKVISPNGASSAPNSRQDGSQMRKRSDAGSEGKPQLDWLQSAPLDCAQTVQFSLTPPRDGGELLAGSTPSATPRTTVDALEATDSNAKSGSHARLGSQHAGATVASSDATEPQLPAPEVCSAGVGLAESSQWYGLTTASYVHHRQAVNAPLLDQQDARALDNNTVLGKQPHSRPQDARCAQIHMQHAGNVTDKQGLLRCVARTRSISLGQCLAHAVLRSITGASVSTSSPLS
jgi:hypothetical protein